MQQILINIENKELEKKHLEKVTGGDSLLTTREIFAIYQI